MPRFAERELRADASIYLDRGMNGERGLVHEKAPRNVKTPLLNIFSSSGALTPSSSRRHPTPYLVERGAKTVIGLNAGAELWPFVEAVKSPTSRRQAGKYSVTVKLQYLCN
jgi:hypothetical protein